jgi:hypothetical protein
MITSTKLFGDNCQIALSGDQQIIVDSAKKDMFPVNHFCSWLYQMGVWQDGAIQLYRVTR